MSFLDRTISDAVAPVAGAGFVRRAEAAGVEEGEEEVLAMASPGGESEEEEVQASAAPAGGASASPGEEEEEVQASRVSVRRELDSGAGSAGQTVEEPDEEPVSSAARAVRRTASAGPVADEEPERTEETVSAVRRKTAAGSAAAPGGTMAGHGVDHAGSALRSAVGRAGAAPGAVGSVGPGAGAARSDRLPSALGFDEGVGSGASAPTMTEFAGRSETEIAGAEGGGESARSASPTVGGEREREIVVERWRPVGDVEAGRPTEDASPVGPIPVRTEGGGPSPGGEGSPVTPVIEIGRLEVIVEAPRATPVAAAPPLPMPTGLGRSRRRL